jgi:hypothetical protein
LPGVTLPHDEPQTTRFPLVPYEEGDIHPGAGVPKLGDPPPPPLADPSAHAHGLIFLASAQRLRARMEAIPTRDEKVSGVGYALMIVIVALLVSAALVEAAWRLKHHEWVPLWW